MIGWANAQLVPVGIGDVATTVTVIRGIYIGPYPLKLCAVAVVCETAIAAHATNTLEVRIYDRGTAGAGSTLVSRNTNDTDVATDAETRVYSAAFAAKDGHVNDFDTNPYEFAAGTVLEVNVLSTGQTADEVTVTLIFRRGD